LLQREAEHNLVLCLAADLSAGDMKGYAPPLYFASVERAGAVEGIAFRTPPFKLGLSRLPPEAVPVLAADVASLYPELPAVMGERRTAEAFALAWCRLRGILSTPGRHSRIHQADALIPPARTVPGCLTEATASDLPLVRDWMGGFLEEVAMREQDPAVVTEHLMRSRGLFLWTEGQPRAMLSAAGYTRNGVRIGHVYTPPPHRGQGFASAAVAALTGRMLGSGRRFCFLYTDLANPTSNAIYARLGYRPVCDVVDVDFAPA
jgi:GNAT superfamily N-acetyltransferase